jgi:Predicted ATP-binding protein involved in virulence
MHTIERLEIDGFWLTHNVRIDFHRDVTFLIGPNGTGKTTVLNLLASALRADYVALSEIDFSEARIALRSCDDIREKAEIHVSRPQFMRREEQFFSYNIFKSLDNSIEQFTLTRQDSVSVSGIISSLSDLFSASGSFTTLQSAIQSIVQFSWLSILRGSVTSAVRREGLSAADLKIIEQSNDIVRYFSSISGVKELLLKQFQQEMFVSLLSVDPQLEAPDENILNRLNDIEGALRSIFDQLDLVDPKARRVISAFIEEAKSLNISSQRTGISAGDTAIMVSLNKVVGLVNEWSDLQEKLKFIDKPKENFIAVANQLFNRKVMSISDSNEIEFESRSGKKLPPKLLSSGEKQLLILLSEVLLQRGAPAVLIADEPELSLHVLWQEKLIGSLRALNPNAQIIVATHSPDIVGPLADKALDMEHIIP